MEYLLFMDLLKMLYTYATHYVMAAFPSGIQTMYKHFIDYVSDFIVLLIATIPQYGEVWMTGLMVYSGFMLLFVLYQTIHTLSTSLFRVVYWTVYSVWMILVTPVYV